MLGLELLPIAVIIFLALCYDFGNGYNDSANAIATVISTKTLTPLKAVTLAAICNLAGPFLVGVRVATTIGKGIVDSQIIDFYIIIAALVGAICCTYLATFRGAPISITHSLIGGLIGAGVVKAGLEAIMVSKVAIIFLFIVVAPLLGFIGGLFFTILVLWCFRKSIPSRVNKYFKRMQLVSAAAYALSHGANDAQNAMGIIAITLFTAGYLGEDFYVPVWVIITCALVISLGTMAGGWRVIRTMGMRITKLRPVDGFNAETAGALTIFYCTLLGLPVSTTHVISGSIVGVGATKRLSAVRWGVTRNILWAWILTIPVSALIGAFTYILITFLL
ncbi:MAG: inorganic phosphate transporter [Candidatus Methanospirareceae archaeon]